MIQKEKGKDMLSEPKIRQSKKHTRRGQSTIEYAIMFAAISAAIVLGAMYFIKPSINKVMRDSSTAINIVSSDFLQGVSGW